MDEEIRCSNCNVVMVDGYEIHNGLYHYCSEKCLHSVMTDSEYKELYNEGYAFWTTFED